MLRDIERVLGHTHPDRSRSRASSPILASDPSRSCVVVSATRDRWADRARVRRVAARRDRTVAASARRARSDLHAAVLGRCRRVRPPDAPGRARPGPAGTPGPARSPGPAGSARADGWPAPANGRPAPRERSPGTAGRSPGTARRSPGPGRPSGPARSPGAARSVARPATRGSSGRAARRAHRAQSGRPAR